MYIPSIGTKILLKNYFNLHTKQKKLCSLENKGVRILNTLEILWKIIRAIANYLIYAELCVEFYAKETLKKKTSIRSKMYN